MIYAYFRATGAYDAAQGLAELVRMTLQSDDVQDFDVRWDQALLSVSEMPSDAILRRIVQVKITGFRSTSDCDGIVRSISCSQQWDTELSTIKNCSETSY